MAKIKNHDVPAGMGVSYVTVQTTEPAKEESDWVGLAYKVVLGGSWSIILMMIGAVLAAQILYS